MTEDQRTKKRHPLGIDIFRTDERMKLVFDHVRNLGICALVGAAARYKFVHATQAGPIGQYLEYAIGAVLALLAIWLFLLNQSHGFHKLTAAGVSRDAALAIGQVYNVAAVSIVLSAAMR